MEFFKYSKELLKNKHETYTTNPFAQNRQVTLVWVDKNSSESTGQIPRGLSTIFQNLTVSNSEQNF